MTRLISSHTGREPRRATVAVRDCILHTVPLTMRKNSPVLNTGAPKGQAVNYLGSEPCSVHGSCKFVLESGRHVKILCLGFASTMTWAHSILDSPRLPGALTRQPK